MKRLNTKPIEILTIDFCDDDGNFMFSKSLKFSAYAMMVLDDEFEGYIQIAEDTKKKPFAAGAKIIYAGIKAIDGDFTYEEAKRLIVSMSLEDIAEIFDFAAKTLGEKRPQQK